MTGRFATIPSCRFIAKSEHVVLDNYPAKTTSATYRAGFT